MTVVAFLPAKGNSDRINCKNKKALNGKPLYLHTLEKLMKCEFIDEVYLDTESEELIELAAYTGCKVLKRDPALADNTTDGHMLFWNEVKQVNADIYIQILGTSPFIEPATIKRGIEILQSRDEYDSVVLVKKEKEYRWENNQPVYDKFHIPNSKDLEDTVIESMGLYLVKRDAAYKAHMRYGEKPYLLEAAPIEAIDVNYEAEFYLADSIMKGIKQQEYLYLKLLAAHINSALLSDILDDLQISGVISGLSPNLPNCKLFGRARTLQLRAVEKGEDYKGIYRALESYETMTLNDIIIVENECSEYAYFGDLNSNLAIRAGASGAIIGGMTRDSAEVAAKNFPVFSKGYHCKDVRCRAVVKSMDKPIYIEGVEINPFDLIFADQDGVVIIPFRAEQTVLAKIKESILKERSVAEETLNGVLGKDITHTVGFF